MLKNYTSSVPASRSISFIEDKLAANGAMQVNKRYDSEGKSIKSKGFKALPFADFKALPAAESVPTTERR